jgi:hypothetical protein
MANIAKPPCDEAVILANPCVAPSRTNGGWVIAATILGSSMAFIDGTVVNVALPALQSALGATISEVQWVVEAYALFLQRCFSRAGLWATCMAGARCSPLVLPYSRWRQSGADLRPTFDT